MPLVRQSVTLNLETLDDRLVPAVVDLPRHGVSAVVGDAIVRQTEVRTTGPGHLHSIVKLEASEKDHGVEQGYNTTARHVQFDEKRDHRPTRALTTGEVPRVTVDGKDYREFRLDINQKSSSPKLSVDEVRLFFADTPNLKGYDPATGTLTAADGSRLAAKFALTDHILLDARTTHGNGAGDMYLLVPDSAFVGTKVGTYVYLYSKMGGQSGAKANGGFEEWSFRSSCVPTQPPVDVAAGSLSGQVRTMNGQGIGGVTIHLHGTDSQGGIVDRDTTTLDDGTYTFAGLRPGTYSLLEVQPDGFASRGTSVGSVDDEVDGTVAANTDNVVSISLGVDGRGLVGVNYDFIEGNIMG